VRFDLRVSRSSIMIPICKRSREVVLERIFAVSRRDVVTALCGVFAVLCDDCAYEGRERYRMKCGVWVQIMEDVQYAPQTTERIGSD
jgi:hypothetical protein